LDIQDIPHFLKRDFVFEYWSHSAINLLTNGTLKVLSNFVDILSYIYNLMISVYIFYFCLLLWV